MKKIIFLTLLFLTNISFACNVIIPDVISFQSGNWNDLSTWKDNMGNSVTIVPDSTVNVKIMGSHVVTMTRDESCKNLIVEGIGNISGNYKLYIKGQ